LDDARLLADQPLADHRIWVNSWQYWDVSIGYGYTCTAKQKQVVRDWYNELGVQHRVVSQ